jgi:hypothetical protein
MHTHEPKRSATALAERNKMENKSETPANAESVGQPTSEAPLAAPTGYVAARRHAIKMIRRQCEEALEHDHSWFDFRETVEQRLETEQAILTPLLKPHTNDYATRVA